MAFRRRPVPSGPGRAACDRSGPDAKDGLDGHAPFAVFDSLIDVRKIIEANEFVEWEASLLIKLDHRGNESLGDHIALYDSDDLAPRNHHVVHVKGDFGAFLGGADDAARPEDTKAVDGLAPFNPFGTSPQSQTSALNYFLTNAYNRPTFKLDNI